MLAVHGWSRLVIDYSRIYIFGSDQSVRLLPQ
jgi:hypothetical protein